MPLKLEASKATSSRVRRIGSLRAKSRVRPISSAATATFFRGARASPATTQMAIRAATRPAIAEMTRKARTPERLFWGTRVDWPAITYPLGMGSK